MGGSDAKGWSVVELTRETNVAGAGNDALDQFMAVAREVPEVGVWC